MVWHHISLVLPTFRHSHSSPKTRIAPFAATDENQDPVDLKIKKKISYIFLFEKESKSENLLKESAISNRECRTGCTAVTSSLSSSDSVDEVREDSLEDD